MINIIKEGDLLLLEYQEERGDNSWVLNALNSQGSVTLRRTFTFSKNLLHSSTAEEIETSAPSDSLQFELGKLEGDYYNIPGYVLRTHFSVFFHKDFPLKVKHFVTQNNCSILLNVLKVTGSDLYIGGENECSVPGKVFQDLVRQFPNTYELRRYTEARISSLIRTYIETTVDAEEKYVRYMNKKKSRIGKDVLKYFSEFEEFKFESLLSKYKEMLDGEASYSEKEWQKEILQIILLLYPKYMRVFPEVPIKDVATGKTRRLDFMLVDSSGNIDVIEIKKPFEKCVVSEKVFRDNFVPLRELSGSIMQVEKYIYYLNRWGKSGERALAERYKDHLPADFKIKITNPSGIIILGRDHKLTSAQRDDFEVVRRKYKNIADILTYDDLMRRLGFLAKKFQGDIVVSTSLKG